MEIIVRHVMSFMSVMSVMSVMPVMSVMSVMSVRSVMSVMSVMSVLLEMALFGIKIWDLQPTWSPLKMVAKSKFSETIFFLQILPKHDILDLKIVTSSHFRIWAIFGPMLDLSRF